MFVALGVFTALALTDLDPVGNLSTEQGKSRNVYMLFFSKIWYHISSCLMTIQYDTTISQ